MHYNQCALYIHKYKLFKENINKLSIPLFCCKTYTKVRIFMFIQHNNKKYSFFICFKLVITRNEI